MRQHDNCIEVEKVTNDPITMPEADSIQVFECFDTLGDDKYPAVRRPAVYPVLLSPDSLLLSPDSPKRQP